MSSSGNLVQHTDRPDSPHLKADETAYGVASEAQLVTEGPGFEAQIIYIRIKRNWNIGWLQVQYIKSGTQNQSVELRASDGTLLGSITGSEQEGEFITDSAANLKKLPDPPFLTLEITGGNNTFLYYAVFFLPSFSGEDPAPGSAVAFDSIPDLGVDWGEF